MTKIRKSAKGEYCQVRIPDCCQGGTETTVLAHIRIAGISGMGLKPPDFIATYACFNCHEIIDRRIKSKFSNNEIDLFSFHGMARTQIKLIEKGLLIVKD